MWIYASQSTIFLVSGASLLLMLWLLSGQQPFGVVVEYARALRDEWRPWTLIWVSVALLLWVNTQEVGLETTYGVSWDFTAWMRFGKGLLLALQRLETISLTHFMTFVYVVLYPMLLPSCLLVFGAKRDWPNVRRIAAGFSVNYVAALPFYWLVPVHEVWSVEADVAFLIPQVYARFETEFRPFSGLDNCFPSLHVAVAVTLTLIAWRSGRKQAAVWLTIAALLIAVSTLYLGIHWVLDLVAGALLAMAATYLAERITSVGKPFSHSPGR